jgi:hypothetical protein
MNAEPEPPMDLHLLQLERELFSLTPSEAPRCLTVRLERQLTMPVVAHQVQRSVTGPTVVPFRWRRIAVPAAAAVAVVSVLHQIDHSRPTYSGLAQTNPGVARPPVQPSISVSTGTGYMLQTEPVYVSPAGWEPSPYQYYIGGEEEAGIRPSQLRRQGAVESVVFH